MADAQRQLVLRTFATANGDVERAAKMLGMSADEVRGEILALVDAGGGRAPAAVRRPTPSPSAAAAEAAPRPKATRKK
jgi:hypothetical protein